jgi:hypothetical protein
MPSSAFQLSDLSFQLLENDMPYQRIEEIQSRRSEKIALFLTVENAAGLIIAALPAYLISAGMPFLLRVLIVGAAGLLGVAMTLDVGGLAFYERLMWRVRGSLRRRVGAHVLTPNALVGTVAIRHDRPLRVGGPIQVRREGRPLALRVAPQPRSKRSDTVLLPETREST